MAVVSLLGAHSFIGAEDRGTLDVSPQEIRAVSRIAYTTTPRV